MLCPLYLLFCFVSEYHKQCQDLETEIAGLAEVGIGTETEMAAADSGAAAGSVAGADLEVILPLLLPATVSKLHSLFRRGQLEGEAAGRQPEGGQLGQGQA